VPSARTSGVILHPTSLPGGRLGREAYEFVDWLAAAGQSWWQVLPLGPPDAFGSPYTSSSAFACWSGLLADPEAKVERSELAQFRARHAFWIGDWERYAGEGAAADQLRFEREWHALRAHARSRGVRLIGDLPMYVAGDSADVAAHPRLFDPELLAGAAPDASHPNGQLWGQPVYRWPTLRTQRYWWWIERFRRSFELVDLLRIDHFRGFVSYWGIPVGSTDPLDGAWHRGPGLHLFRAVEAELGRLPLIAEDLGVITPAVDRLRDAIGALSMRIIGRSFMKRHRRRQAVAVHPADSVVYTGTHDHPTLAGWLASASKAERRRATGDLVQAGIAEEESVWPLIRLAFSSRARIAIVPMQDVLELGDEGRMNWPGTVGPGNWTWRLPPDALTPELAERLRSVTVETGRAQQPVANERRAAVFSRA